MSENEKMESIKKRVFKYPGVSKLEISRIPKDVKKLIVDYANKHCCGDYGWAISVLLGPINEEIVSLIDAVNELDERLKKVELEKVPAKKPKGRQRFIKKDKEE
jgi:hypothetical protein